MASYATTVMVTQYMQMSKHMTQYNIIIHSSDLQLGLSKVCPHHHFVKILAVLAQHLFIL